MTVYLLRELNFNFALPDFAFDAMTGESFSAPFGVSEYPLEFGAEASSYVHQLPKTWDLTGVVTAQPFEPTLTPYRRQDILESLVELAEERQPLTVVSPNWVQDSVVITHVQADHGLRNGDAFVITVSLQKLNRVGFQVVSIPPELLRADVKPDSTADQLNAAYAAGASPTPGSPAANAADSWAFQGRAVIQESGTITASDVASIVTQ